MPIDFTCPHCGKSTSVAEEYAGLTGPCVGCGKTVTIPGTRSPYGDVPVPPPDPGQDPTMRLILPVGRSLWAIAAGYCGLISILGCPAPFAIILAMIAMHDIKRHPEKHGMGRAIFGLLMGCLCTAAMIAGFAFANALR